MAPTNRTNNNNNNSAYRAGNSTTVMKTSSIRVEDPVRERIGIADRVRYAIENAVASPIYRCTINNIVISFKTNNKPVIHLPVEGCIPANADIIKVQRKTDRTLVNRHVCWIVNTDTHIFVIPVGPSASRIRVFTHSKTIANGLGLVSTDYFSDGQTISNQTSWRRSAFVIRN